MVGSFVDFRDRAAVFKVEDGMLTMQKDANG